MAKLLKLSEVAQAREPNSDLIDILERALAQARSGEIIAGAACFVADAAGDTHTHWNVIGTYDHAYVAVGMLMAEVHDISSRTRPAED